MDGLSRVLFPDWFAVDNEALQKIRLLCDYQSSINIKSGFLFCFHQCNGKRGHIVANEQHGSKPTSIGSQPVYTLDVLMKPGNIAKISSECECECVYIFCVHICKPWHL